MGLKIAALALSCAILGGAAGAGVTAAVKSHSGSGTATVNVSDRTASQVVLKSVDGKTELTDAENYAANVNSVVSINCSATTNYFGQTVESASSGSGFILTQDGFVVTNHHVIDGATSVKVTLYDGETYDATVIGSDSDYDIAVLKIDAAGLTPVTLGDSSLLNVGDHVLALGNPLGELTFSASEGIASSVNRTINVSGIPFNMIQVTCAVNPGNSGGPLFNAYGEVVGIVSAKYSGTASSSSSETVEGLGFAIPINDVLAMIEDIMTNGYVTDKAYMGIVPNTLTAQMAMQYRYDISEGVFISYVEENSPASEAGLQMGDVITAIDGESVKGQDIDSVRTKIRSRMNTQFNVEVGGRDEYTVDCTKNYVSPVTYRMEKTEAGYVKIDNFEAGSGQDAINAVETLLNQGATALVIDLRGNAGGLAAETRTFLDYLLPGGTLFESVDKAGNKVRYESDNVCIQLPMCVLINAETHAEAEVFAAVMKEFQAASLVGEATTGDTRTQSTIEISDGSAMRISTGSYLTAGGTDISKAGGVIPDRIIYNSDSSATGTTSGTVGESDGTAVSSNDEQLVAALTMLSMTNLS